MLRTSSVVQQDEREEVQARGRWAANGGVFNEVGVYDRVSFP